MKQLTLIRHARAEPGGISHRRDAARPLSVGGRHEAGLTAGRLRLVQWQPECMMTSPAARAASTADIIAAETGYPPENIRYEPRLYSASFESMLEFIAGLPDEFSRIALVGHNPVFTDLAAMLSKTAVDYMPTAAAACLIFTATAWRDVPRMRGELTWFTPEPRLPAAAPA